MESKQLAESYFRQFNLIVLGIVCSAIPSLAGAVWTNVSPPSGAVLNYTLTPTNPATVFATNGGAMADRGVWRSTNSGGAWFQVNDSANYKGAAVKIDAANVVLAAVSPGGVERSTTSGDIGSWAVTAGSGSTDNWVFGFAPSDPTTVYAGGATGIGAGVLQKSTNSGANWSAQSIDGDATPAIYSIAVDPTNANIAYAGSRPDGALNDGLYKTTDGGANWTRLTTLNFTLVDALVIDPVDSNIIYAGTSGVDEIWRSLDAGATWAELFDASGNGLTNFNLRGITIDVGDRRVIYAAGGSTTKVVASSDCGANWSNVTSTGITGSPSNVLIDSSNNFVYVVENILNGNLYREVLGTGLAAASGACPATGGPGPGPGPAPAPAGGGGGGGGGGGSPGLVFMLALLGIKGFQGLKGKKTFKKS